MTDIVLERPVDQARFHVAHPEHDDYGLFDRQMRIGAEAGTLASASAASLEELLSEDIELLGLTELDLQIYEYATANQSFRVEEMRRAIATLRDMPEDVYKDFKDQFEENRERILRSLEQQGINLTWHKTGRTRGTRYQLMHPDDIPVPEVVLDLTDNTSTQSIGVVPVTTSVQLAPERAPALSPEESRERVRAFFKAVRFTNTLLASLESQLGADSPRGARRRDIQDHITRQLGEGVCAQTLVVELTEVGLLKKAPSNAGHAYLSTAAVTVERSEQPAAVTESEKEQPLESLRAAYVSTALKVLEVLSGHKHVQQGTQVKRLYSDLKMPELSYPQFRSIIIQLDKFKIVTRNVDTRVSRNKRVEVIKITSKAVKEEYEDRRLELITRLEAQALSIKESAD